MATYLSDDGICLRVNDFSETSQIVGVFTRGHGMVPLIAKGVKRESKKGVVSGPLDLLTSGEVVFVPARGVGAGGGAALGTLAAWDLVDHRTALRSDLRSLNGAMICAEVTTLLVHPHDPHPDLYDELEAALGLLAAAEQRARAVVSYVKAALVAAGYGPQLTACMTCGRRVAAEGQIRFYPAGGGVGCAGCTVEGASGGIGVAGRIVVALDRLEKPTTLAAAPPTRTADAAALGVALELMLRQVEAVTDREVRTRWLMRSVFA